MNKLFKNKKFRYGTYSTAVTMVVLAILVAINLVVSRFDYKVDLTEEGVFSLSDETVATLKGTDKTINIYTLFSTKEGDTVISRVQQVLEQYRLHDGNIHVENKDLYLYPDFAKDYASDEVNVDQNSIIVESGEKYRVISYADYYENGVLSIEENITSAIQFVTSEKNSKIYFVSGHGEVDPSQLETISKEFKLNNYSVDTINLIEKDVPDDCTVLFVTPVGADYSKEEAQKVKDYLMNDGRAMFMLMGVEKEAFPNLCSVLSEYGLESISGFVLEGEGNYIQYPVAVIPHVENHEITKSVSENKYTLLAYMSQAFKETEVKRQGLVMEPLLTTSKESYVKGVDAVSMNKETGDEEGPFTLAYGVTDSDYTDKKHTTKVVVSGTFSMLLPDTESLVNNSGKTFIMGCIRWLDEGSSQVSISSKSIVGESLVINDGDKTKIQLVSWGIIPGVLFLAGFVVWIRRRNG